MKFPFSGQLPTVTRQEEEQRKKDLEGIKVPFGDRMLMIGVAFVWLVLPCALLIVGLGLLMLWIFGAL